MSLNMTNKPTEEQLKRYANDVDLPALWRIMARELLERRKADSAEPAAQIKWNGTELSVQNVRDGFSYGVTDIYTAPQQINAELLEVLQLVLESGVLSTYHANKARDAISNALGENK